MRLVAFLDVADEVALRIVSEVTDGAGDPASGGEWRVVEIICVDASGRRDDVCDLVEPPALTVVKTDAGLLLL